MVQQPNIWTIESGRALGAALRSLRERQGLTQEDLAHALKTTRQRISRMERGDMSDQVLVLLLQLKVLGAVLRVEETDVGA